MENTAVFRAYKRRGWLEQFGVGGDSGSSGGNPSVEPGTLIPMPDIPKPMAGARFILKKVRLRGWNSWYLPWLFARVAGSCGHARSRRSGLPTVETGRDGFCMEVFPEVFIAHSRD